MMISKNFKLQEFIDEYTFEKFGEKSLWFIDERVITIAQTLRDHFGAATINNWHVGGVRHWAGLRTVQSSYYSPYSSHSFGRAVDMIFKNATADEVRKYILDNEDIFLSLGMGAIEENVSWLHFDCRNLIDSNHIYKFKK